MRAQRDSPALCPFCGSPEVSGRLVLRGKTYLICSRCDTQRLSPRRPPEETTRFYERDYGPHFLARAESPGRRTVLESLFRRLGPPDGRRLLDIGSATGLLVKMAREAGWDAQGTELSEQCRELARSRHGIDLLDPRSRPPDDAVYDVVTLVNVLDQAPAPAELLREAVRVLRPGGRLVLRLPNADFIQLWIRVTSALRWKRAERAVVLHDFLFPRRSLTKVFPLFELELARIHPSRPADFQPASSIQRFLAVLASGTFVDSLAWLSRGTLLGSLSIEVEARRAGPR